mmetsp:Transcript_10276/g.16790  ORF Transcript_10276/g.16790 Transcript_10276/m.16790 type:complete len:90 (-) Transcript_10276:109-378(-)
MYVPSDSPDELSDQEKLQEEALVGLFLLGTEEGIKDSKPAAIKLVDMYNEINPQAQIYLCRCVGRDMLQQNWTDYDRTKPDSILVPRGV